MTSRPRTTLAALAILAALAAIPACQTPGSDPGVTPEQVAQLERRLQRSREGLATLPVDDPSRVAAERAIAELERLVAAYKAHREGWAADGSADPEASIAAGVQAVAPFLPPPWNAVLLIAGGLLPGVAGWMRESVRRSRAQQAGRDLARAIKAAAIANGCVLDFTDPAVRESLKAAMPEAARALVKDSGASVPLPLVTQAPTPEVTPEVTPEATPVVAPVAA